MNKNRAEASDQTRDLGPREALGTKLAQTHTHSRIHTKAQRLPPCKLECQVVIFVHLPEQRKLSINGT